MTSLKDVLNLDKHEDWVQYLVFPCSEHQENAEDTLFQLNAMSQSIIRDYIWQNDPFALRRGTTPLSTFEEEDQGQGQAKKKDPTYFYGITRFGDNLEDEWFVVHILRELSKAFPDVVIKVDDNDGEFLLIEAADHLPPWAESDESCKNRVYIYQGQIHLIPKNLCGSENDNMKIEAAVRLVQTHSSLTLASENIQKAIDKRIGKYPEKMEANFHHANVMLPPILATILKDKPTLVSAGSLAFYLRDPISLKATRLMKTFKPSEGLVKTRVRFTKCLYAMLMKQDFRPDTRSGWPLPSTTCNDYKANNLGAKLTTGFEIALEQCKKSDQLLNGNTLEKDPLENDSGWLRYEETLKKAGYFRDYMEGSKPYKNLQGEAKDFYKTNLQKNDDDSSIQFSWKDSVFEEIKHLVHNSKVDKDRLEEESTSLPHDDDDSWLAINPEDLESLLEAKFQSGGLNPDDIPSKLKEFMKKISDFSGVETGDASGGNFLESSTSSGSPRESDTVEPFDFKADEFVSALDKILHDLGAPDKEWDASEDSYGSDEDEFDVDLESIKKMHTFSKESKEFFGIMDDMDKELASTTIGQTFKTPKPKKDTQAPASEAPASSSSGKSRKATTAQVEELDEFDEEEGLTPVNIDMNALANMLESFQNQEGPSGPSSNLLRSMGFDIAKASKKK